jgi:hypothetical protein
MCDTLAGLRACAKAQLTRFDPALVPLGDLAQVVRDAGAVEKMMATWGGLAAAHMAGRGPKVTGRRQAVRDLAQASGTSLGEASRALEAAEAVRSQPEVDAAARSGELSRPQLGLVAGAAKDNPESTGRLLELARTGSLSELADEAARARAAGADFEARRRAIHAARSLRSYTDASGAWAMHAKGLPEDGAKVMAAISALADKAFELARKDGRREGPEAYAYDGLVALAGAGGAGAPSTEVIVRVDHTVLLRGYGEDGETCEVAGCGPISAQAVYDIMDSADPFLKAVVTKGKDVLSVAHLGRRPNAHQQSALDWLFPTCAVEGCGTRAQFLQTDHREDWARTHMTVLDLLDRLCRYHHALKTNQGWALVEGRGKRPFVGPDDPRHPRHVKAPGAGAGDGQGPPRAMTHNDAGGHEPKPARPVAEGGDDGDATVPARPVKPRNVSGTERTVTSDGDPPASPRPSAASVEGDTRPTLWTVYPPPATANMRTKGTTMARGRRPRRKIAEPSSTSNRTTLSPSSFRTLRRQSTAGGTAGGTKPENESRTTHFSPPSTSPPGADRDPRG